MPEKKTYSTQAYLSEKEFQEFSTILREEKITAQELADIEGLGRTREAMNARLRKKRILRGFANAVLESKEAAVEDIKNKFKKRF